MAGGLRDDDRRGGHAACGAGRSRRAANCQFRQWRPRRVDRGDRVRRNPGQIAPALAVQDFPRRRLVAASDETAYLNLREQVLRFGVESWKPPAPVVAAATSAAEPVLSCREPLDLLLAEEGGS